MKMIPAGASGMNPPTLNDYGALLKRLIKVYEGDETEAKFFLDTQLVRNSVNPDKPDWNWTHYQEIAKTVHEFEQQVKSLKPRKPRQAKKEIEEMEDLFGDTEPAPEQGVNANGEVDLLGGMDEAPQQQAPPPPNNPDCPTEEEAAEAAKFWSETFAAKVAAAREVLGIPENEVVSIKNKEHADKILRKRALLFNELAYIVQAYDDAKKTIEAGLDAWDFLYEAQLASFRKLNPPATGKSLKLLYGELKHRDAPMSVSYDTERDGDRSRFKAWLLTAPPELKKAIEVQEIEIKDIVCNRDKFDAWFKAQGKPPVVPGIKFTPPEKDKFSVGPSLDTVKEQIRKRTYQEQK